MGHLYIAQLLQKNEKGPYVLVWRKYLPIGARRKRAEEESEVEGATQNCCSGLFSIVKLENTTGNN